MDKNMSYSQMKIYRELANYCFDKQKNAKSDGWGVCGIVNLIFSCEKGFKGIIENNYYDKMMEETNINAKRKIEADLFKNCKDGGHHLLPLFEKLEKCQQQRLLMFMKNKDIKNYDDLRRYLKAENDTYDNFRFPQEFSKYDKLGTEIKSNIFFLLKLNDSLQKMYDSSVRTERKVRKIEKLLKKNGTL